MHPYSTKTAIGAQSISKKFCEVNDYKAMIFQHVIILEKKKKIPLIIFVYYVYIHNFMIQINGIKLLTG